MRRFSLIGTWVCAVLVVLGCGSAAFANIPYPGDGGAPEIDPGTLGPALTVLIGGLMILGGARFRRK